MEAKHRATRVRPTSRQELNRHCASEKVDVHSREPVCVAVQKAVEPERNLTNSRWKERLCALCTFTDGPSILNLRVSKLCRRIASRRSLQDTQTKAFTSRHRSRQNA